jgi:hypothetical protein
VPADGAPQERLAILPGSHVLRVSFRYARGETRFASAAPESVPLEALAGRTYEVVAEVREVGVDGVSFLGPTPNSPTTDARMRWAPLIYDVTGERP